MNRSILSLCTTATLVLGFQVGGAHAAAIHAVYVDTLIASTTIGGTVNAGDTVYLDALVTGSVGPLAHSVTFTLDSGVDSLRGSATWMISEAAGAGPRLIGVNLDLFDSSDTLVASDSFAGTLGGFAFSTFAGAIGPGTYRLVATGTGVRDSSLDVSLSFVNAAGTPPAVPALDSGGLPVQGASLTAPPVLYSTLVDSRTVTQPLGALDSLFLDTLVTSEAGALSQSTTFTLDAGVTGFLASSTWLLSTAAGPGPRLIGVNIDLFDSSNVLVATDNFNGTIAEFAASTFGGPIGPGTYRLVVTGTGARDSSMNVGVRFTGTPVPDPPAVPEPATGGLLLAGLGMLATRRRRPKAPVAGPSVAA